MSHNCSFGARAGARARAPGGATRVLVDVRADSDAPRVAAAGSVRAYAYVMPHRRPEFVGEWSLSAFRERWLDDYVSMCEDFAAELVERGGEGAGA